MDLFFLNIVVLLGALTFTVSIYLWRSGKLTGLIAITKKDTDSFFFFLVLYKTQNTCTVFKRCTVLPCRTDTIWNTVRKLCMPLCLQYAKCLVCNPALGTCVLSKARRLFTSNLQLICIEAQKKKKFLLMLLLTVSMCFFISFCFIMWVPTTAFHNAREDPC